MKKLLVVSLLAAALTSTAAFAVNENGAGNGKNAPAALLVASQADTFSASGLAVAQFLVNELQNSRPSVNFKGISVDAHGVTMVKFAKAINAKQRSTVVEAALALTRIGGKSFGWKVLAAKPGNGPMLFVMAVADPSQNSGVTTIAAIAKGPNVVLKQIANDPSLVKQVEQAKAQATLKEVQANVA